jgi:acyl dehydratase
MVEVETLADVPAWLGQELGSSDWMVVDQALIDDFARVSGDHNWIHVDVERAQRELPAGKTIAHGMLTLSLVTRLGADIFRVRQRDRSVNYGSNKVRFITPVPSGARIRLHRSLVAADPVDGGLRLTFGNRVELEGQERPAMVAETLSVVYTKKGA